MIIDQVLFRNSTIRLKEETNNGRIAAKESTKRSLIKTISWRVIGTADTILISWLITGTLVFALSIGMIELVTKMVLYFFHERVWNSINYGK